MEELKLKLKSEIIKQREESVLSYNARLDEVDYSENAVQVLEMIIDTYSNKDEREDVIINLMGLTLTNDFFRESEIIRENTTLAFSNGGYKVHFCTIGAKYIKIEYVAGSNPEKTKVANGLMSETEEQHKKELLELLKVYIKETTFKSFKAVSRHYNNSKSISKYFKTLTNCTPKFERKLIKELSVNEDRKEINRLAEELYEANEEKAIEFLNSLTDLKLYRENHWNFMLENETGMSSVKDEDLTFD